MARAVLAAVRAKDSRGYASLAHPDQRDKLVKAFGNALLTLEAMEVAPTAIRVKKKECTRWGDNNDTGECNFFVEAKGKRFRVHVDDSKKTPAGWRMWSFVRIQDWE